MDDTLIKLTQESGRIAKYQPLIDSGAAQVSVRLDGSGDVAEIKVRIVTATREEAAEIASRFPKSLRVRASSTSGSDYYDHEVTDPRYSKAHKLDDLWAHTWEVGTVSFSASFAADGVNKGANETGLKRYRSFVKNAAKLGIPLTFAPLSSASDVESHGELDELLARI